MKTKKETSKRPTGNALAESALQSLRDIEKDAREKRLTQLDSLQNARKEISRRIEELTHQIVQIDAAIESVTGKPSGGPPRPRRNLDEIRKVVMEWMKGQPAGLKLAAGDFIKQFPDLAGTPISILLKPFIQDKTVGTDDSQGVRRMKYFVMGDAE